MINLAISIAIAAVLYTGAGFALTGGASFNPWYGILPALIGLVGSYLYLVRRVLKQVELIMAKAQAELMKMHEGMTRSGKRPSKRQMTEHVDRAIDIIKSANKFKHWQFLIDAQVNGQVGTLLYMNKRFDEAEPYLRNSFMKNWVSQAMLAALHFKRKEYDEMKEVFERAVKGNKKESLLWAMYAWCLWKNKDRDGAIAVLTRSKEHIDDDRIKSNLEALQNNKKMKMQGWKEQWYQFQLAKPPAMKVQQFMGGRMSKKALYR